MYGVTKFRLFVCALVDYAQGLWVHQQYDRQKSLCTQITITTPLSIT